MFHVFYRYGVFLAVALLNHPNMKTAIAILTLLLSASFLPTDQLNIGDKAPQQKLELEAIQGAKTSLEKAMMKNGVCVIFSCNTCPYVVAWEDRYNELYKTCSNAGVGMIVVNSNEAKREGADSMDEMKKHAKEVGYLDFAYVVDKNHVLADAFGATKTPDVFLFNGDMELVYKGAIDDNMKAKDKVEEPYLMNAISALVSGTEIKPNTTKAIGCSIKRIKS